MFTLRTVQSLKNHQNPKALHRWASLFVDFLSANSLIHIIKNGQNNYFSVKNGLFICEFKILGQKWWNVSTANNEGNLYLITKFLFLRQNQISQTRANTFDEETAIACRGSKERTGLFWSSGSSQSYSVFQGFSKAESVNGGSILSSSQFLILTQLL